MIAFLILGWLLGVLGVVGTWLPLLPYDDYWIRGFDYPRVQLVVVLLIAGSLLSFYGLQQTMSTSSWILLGACLASLGLQAVRIFPYTPIAPNQVVAADVNQLDEQGQLKLIISNVLQSNERYDLLTALINSEQPHLVLTLESNATWEKELLSAFAKTYPHTVKVPLENRYGMHLFSKYPLRNSEVMHLIEDDIPSIYTQVQLPIGDWINLYCVHPTPPSPTEESTSTARDAELALVGELVTERSNRNTIVAGDLNDVAWSHSTRLFQRLSGLLDPRRGRGFFPSFHADYWFARWPLDHVFHSDEFQLIKMGLGPHVGSDHFPIVITLQHLPHHDDEMEADELEDGDLEEANETIETAKRGEVDGLLIDEK